MRYRLLGATGLRVSELCLGAMTFGDARGGWGAEAGDVDGMVRRFGEAGGNFVDTANYYAGGESERLLGRAIAADRDRWVLSTKYTLSTDRADPNAGGTHRKNLRRSIDASLRRLSTEYVDVLWVHIWDRFTPLDEVVAALDDVVRSGKALYLGISDTPAWIVARAVTLARERGLAAFSALQVPYSLVERTVERELLPMAAGLDLAVTAWSPLGGGLLTGRYGTDRAHPTDSRLAGIGGSFAAQATSDRNLRIADALNTVAAELGASSAQVALAWLLSRQDRSVVVPILGVRTPEQLADNLGCLDVGLPVEALARLEDASAIEPGFPEGFAGAGMAYGDTLERVVDHRRGPRGRSSLAGW